MTFDLSPDQARTIEHMAWFIRHPEVWDGGTPIPGTHIPAISWPEGVEPVPADSHWHSRSDAFCFRSATQTIDGQVVLHSYHTRTECADVCTTCGDHLTGDETGRCHRCEHGDDDAIEVA